MQRTRGVCVWGVCVGGGVCRAPVPPHFLQPATASGGGGCERRSLPGTRGITKYSPDNSAGEEERGAVLMKVGDPSNMGCMRMMYTMLSITPSRT